MKRILWSVVIGLMAAAGGGFFATAIAVLYEVHQMPPAPPGEPTAIGWDLVSLTHAPPPWAVLMLLAAFCLGFSISYRRTKPRA